MEPPKACPCLFLVPVAYNDGREIEPEVVVEIASLLNVRFGAHTRLSRCTGSWEGQTEDSMLYMVSVSRERVEELKAVVKGIGKRLEQRAMWFAAGTGIEAEVMSVE